mgnify:CR=1 FL=1
MIFYKNGPGGSKKNDKDIQKLLLTLLSFTTSELVALLKDFSKLTGVPVNLRKTFGRVYDVERCKEVLKTGLAKLENSITSTRSNYLTSIATWVSKKLRYFSWTNLKSREVLESPLPHDESMTQLEVTQSKQHAQYENSDAEMRTVPSEIDSRDFEDNQGQVKLLRKINAVIHKLALASLKDTLLYVKIQFRVFQPLERIDIPNLSAPIRTNLLAEVVPIYCYLLGVSALLSLVPEWIILKAFAKYFLLASPREAQLFPILFMVTSKFFGVYMKPMIRRFMQSTPVLPRYIVVTAILAIVFSLGYGYLTAVNINEKKVERRIEVLRKNRLSLQEQAFLSESPEEKERISEKMEKLDAEITQQERILLDDPYFAKPISYFSLLIASGVVLIVSALLTGVFIVMLEMVLLQKAIEKAEKAFISAPELYADQLSKLHSARELYLLIIFLLQKKNEIEKLIHLNPKASDFDTITDDEIKQIEAEINQTLHSKHLKQ